MGAMFRHPALLVVLMLIPLALLVWTWVRRSRGVALPLDHSTGKHRIVWWLVLTLFETWPVLLVAVVILILCGPIELGEPRTRRKVTNIEFCVDISGSMTAPFGGGSRYDASMAAINEFIDYRTGDAMGLTFFGNSVMHWVPLTTDPSAIRHSVPFMRPEIAPQGFGGTEIGKALRACREVLIQRDDGERMIVLVSDGASFDLANGGDIEIAKELSEDNIILYTIHIGGGTISDPVSNVTGLTGGEVFQPGDTEALGDVFRRIDQMQRAETETISAETMDFYWPYCLAGLVLAGVSILGSFGLRYTPW